MGFVVLIARAGLVVFAAVVFFLVAASGFEFFVANRAQLFAHLVALPARLQMTQREDRVGVTLPAQIDPADDHATEVSDVADVLPARKHHRHHEESGDQPDRAKRYRREDQHDGAIGPGQRVAEQYAVDGTGRAEGMRHHPPG